MSWRALLGDRHDDPDVIAVDGVGRHGGWLQAKPPARTAPA
jgi:hypothetical protein